MGNNFLINMNLHSVSSADICWTFLRRCFCWLWPFDLWLISSKSSSASFLIYSFFFFFGHFCSIRLRTAGREKSTCWNNPQSTRCGSLLLVQKFLMQIVCLFFLRWTQLLVWREGIQSWAAFSRQTSCELRAACSLLSVAGTAPQPVHLKRAWWL